MRNLIHLYETYDDREMNERTQAVPYVTNGRFGPRVTENGRTHREP
jgi:hypothetical protein